MGTRIGFCFVIFFENPFPVPALGDEELPGREVLVESEATRFGKGFGPVDRRNSAISRVESSFAVGSRAIEPGVRGPGDLGTDLGAGFPFSGNETGGCVDVVGLVLLAGLDRRPFSPLSLFIDRDVGGRSVSGLVGAEFRKKSASSAVSVRE